MAKITKPKRLTKVCSDCFKRKPLTSFHKKLNGVQSKCKPCNKAVAKQYAKERTSRRIKMKWKQLRAEHK